MTSRGIEIREAMTDYHGIITGVPERRGGPSGVAHTELTTTEAIVLDAMLRLGETTAEVVAGDTGLVMEQIQQSMDRLLAVGYVRAVERGKRTLYHASPRSLR